jgi:hypothetical protein
MGDDVYVLGVGKMRSAKHQGMVTLEQALPQFEPVVRSQVTKIVVNDSPQSRRGSRSVRDPSQG